VTFTGICRRYWCWLAFVAVLAFVVTDAVARMN
jgi:hypothetical protein